MRNEFRAPNLLLDAPQFHSNGETVKNITVSIDDEVYRRARIKAAEQNSSVSALVGTYLKQLAGFETEAEIKRRRMNEILDRMKGGVGKRVSREELHDRESLR